MRDIDLCIQAEWLSLVKLIEGDDHRPTKAACHLVDQRCDRYTQSQHLLERFGLSLEIGLMSMAECIQATKAYYLTVDTPAVHCYQISNMSSWENMIYTSFSWRIQRYMQTLWWMATRKSCLGKWRSFFMSLTIQTTTTCSSNQSFNSALMVTSNNSFHGLHVREYVQGMIKAMSTSGVSGCASTLINIWADKFSFNHWRSIWPSLERLSWFVWYCLSPSKCLVSVSQVIQVIYAQGWQVWYHISYHNWSGQ